MSRNKARIVAMQSLFHLDSDPEMMRPVVEDRALEEALDDRDLAYVEDLVNKVVEGRERIDADIQRLAIDWDVNRLGKVERAVLRLAMGEILFVEGVPTSVAINEAVNLAKKYGSENAGKFINGILGKFARELPVEDEKKTEST